jgi:hypothetical protein
MLPTPFARLHRRLRNTVLVARTASATSPAASTLAGTIEAQAIALDHHLVVTARLRAGRYEGLRALTSQVGQLETLAGRLAHATIDAQRHRALPPGDVDPLAEIASRLDALDSARSDLTRIERAAGLN